MTTPPPMVAPGEILDWVHLTEDIPETGVDTKRTASAEQLQAVSLALGVTACEHMAISYTLHGIMDGTYRLAGRLKARVVQPCVITLEPVTQEIEEALGVDYWPADQMPEPAKGEITVLEDDADMQPLIDGRIDVGAVAYEVLASAVDLYPRKAGATFEWEDKAAGGAQPAKVNPFSVLAKLKDKP
jgi:uncharacterized metal-binding protein YceD (DUF177 family)